MSKGATIRPAAQGFGTLAGGKHWARQTAGTLPLQGQVFPAPEPTADGGEAGQRLGC